MSKRTSESVTSPVVPPPQEKDSDHQPLKNSDSATTESEADRIKRVKAEIWESVLASFAAQEKHLWAMKRENERLESILFSKNPVFIRGAFIEEYPELHLRKEDEECPLFVNGHSDDADDDDDEEEEEASSDEVISSGGSVPEKKCS